jgi:formate C-acetyltransferase
MVIEAKPKPELSERVRRLRETLFEQPACLDSTRLRCLMEVYTEFDGAAEVIKRAKVFERLLSEVEIFIDDNLIVGNQSKYRKGLVPFPEYSCRWMRREGEVFTSMGKTTLTEEDRELLTKAVDYWEDKCIASRANELYAWKHPGEARRNDYIKYGVWNDHAGTPPGRVSVNYPKVLTEGLNGVIAEAEGELGKLSIISWEDVKKKQFLDAVIISCKAVITWANRYALLAEAMAEKEADPKRKEELQTIARACRWVPANPPRSFHEALQSFWFTHLAVQIERNSDGISPGRFPQYIYPFYKKDRDAGRITEEDAMELLQMLFIRFTEVTKFWSHRLFQEDTGNLLQTMSLGGVDEKGQDATSDMDFLCLEAQKRLRLIQPNVTVLYHDRMSDEFLLKTAELVSIGTGMPPFFNNDLNIEGLMASGLSLEDARNTCTIGCVERGAACTVAPMQGAGFSMAKMLELALHNGKDPLSGIQMGPQTGDPKEFESYEELRRAVREQLAYFVSRNIEYEYGAHTFIAEYYPVPFISALMEDCIKRGRDVYQGGARYSLHGFGPVGTVDLADSMAAIKKLVFEDKALTMKELLAALEANFQGHEEVRRKLLDAPKYGNDDDYADLIVREWYDAFYHTVPFALSVSFHFPLGVRCGALPSGREAGLPLSDASVSPEPGKDRQGPTALIRSTSKALDTVKYGSGQLNMKFHPRALQSVDGLRKLIALIKTYMDLGGHHIQFNVVSAETMKDAQLHPENYKDLIVRVAGFSAFFVHLDPFVQNEIIKRTEVELS